MSLRNLLAGGLIILGSAGGMITATAFVVSMQLDVGSGLAIGVAALAGAALALMLGLLLLVRWR